jgi:hypothetical protein
MSVVQKTVYLVPSFVFLNFSHIVVLQTFQSPHSVVIQSYVLSSVVGCSLETFLHVPNALLIDVSFCASVLLH